MSFKVAEIFTSINGEGRRAGELSVFVRFSGCNLRCSYCDTSWVNEENAKYILMSTNEILCAVVNTGIKNVTLTGGEPLLVPGVKELIEILGDNNLRVEVETNGSVPIKKYELMRHRPSMTLDYKLPGSGMEGLMCLENYRNVLQTDTVKFVCSDEADLIRAKEIISDYNLTKHCAVYLSPVFGKIDPAFMVDFMKANNMNDVRLQLQLHKFIWDPAARGV